MRRVLGVEDVVGDVVGAVVLEEGLQLAEPLVAAHKHRIVVVDDLDHLEKVVALGGHAVERVVGPEAVDAHLLSRLVSVKMFRLKLV